MAIISCKWFHEGDDGEDTPDTVSFTRVLIVQTDDQTDGPGKVIDQLKYPEPGVELGSVTIKRFDQYHENKRAVLQSARAQRTGPTTWLVTLSYSSQQFKAMQQSSGSTPLAGVSDPVRPSGDSLTGSTNAKPATDRLPTYTYSTKVTEEPGEQYYDWVSSETKPYVNPVGDPIEGLNVRRYAMCIDITYYSNEMTDTEIENRKGKVNMAPYGDYPIGGCLITDVKREDVYDYLGDDADGPVVGLVWKVTVSIECVKIMNYWRTKVLNTGRRGRIIAGGPIVTFYDPTGAETGPIPIDEDGIALRDPGMTSPTPIAASEFSYTTYRDVDVFDFDDLLI